MFPATVSIVIPHTTYILEDSQFFRVMPGTMSHGKHVTVSIYPVTEQNQQP
jgi:hypothetical protein